MEVSSKQCDDLTAIGGETQHKAWEHASTAGTLAAGHWTVASHTQGGKLENVEGALREC